MDYACDSGDADLQLCWEHAQEKPQSNAPEFLNLVQVVMDEEKKTFTNASLCARRTIIIF